MRFEDLSWFDVEKYLKTDDRLMLVLGACEQHGYLSLLTDVKIPQALADAASQKTGVLIAPVINYGLSPYFIDYPGSFSLRVSTLLDMVEDLIRSADHQGFRRILILNGHGGNDATRARLYEIANALPKIQIAWYAWWQAHSVEEVAIRYGLRSFHAAWIEAFPFTRLGDLPDGEKIPARIPGLVNAKKARELYQDGVFGGAYKVDDAILTEVFNAALDDIVRLLQFE
ncbi:MAG: creatininase family protein [Anaerolineales bacterium]